MAPRPIQIALALEATMNIYGAAAIYYDPTSLLKLLLPPATVYTGALKSQVEWVAALTLGVTLPILLCIPERPNQTTARRTLYTTFMGFEACMVFTALAQYVRGNSGFIDGGVLGTAAVFAGFTSLRIFFLYAKPDWIAVQSESKAKLK